MSSRHRYRESYRGRLIMLIAATYVERSHAGQDPAITNQNVSMIRYPSEETVAELTKEEKVGPDRCCHERRI